MIEEAKGKVLDACPEEIRKFASDKEGDFRLTKTQNFREGFVYDGDSVRGYLEIVEVIGRPAVRVTRSFKDYIRTSPIVKVLDVTENSVTFQTEGGVYKLDKLSENINAN